MLNFFVSPIVKKIWPFEYASGGWSPPISDHFIYEVHRRVQHPENGHFGQKTEKIYIFFKIDLNRPNDDF